MKITGVMLYYYFVCKRKLWYFYHELCCEGENENVKIGKILDETSYNREEKHINIDDVINIDFVKKSGILHEIKKSRKIEDASIWQVKYYLYYLKERGVNDITAKLDYPLLKQTMAVTLEKDDISKIEEVLEDMQKILLLPLPPPINKMRICRMCAYYDMCFI